MPTNFIVIANQGYSHIAAKDHLESPNERSVVGAQYRLWFEQSRLETLEGFDWSFARRKKALGLHGDAPPDDWLFRYSIPADCLTPRRIQNPLQTAMLPDRFGNGTVVSGSDAIPFDQETSLDGSQNTIVTNEEDAVLVYTFDQTNPNLYSHTFIQALGYRFAYNTCLIITGKADLKQTMLQNFIQTLTFAEADNANAQVDTAPRDSEFIRVR